MNELRFHPVVNLDGRRGQFTSYVLRRAVVVLAQLPITLIRLIGREPWREG
jgi:hypothetical protein